MTHKQPDDNNPLTPAQARQKLQKRLADYLTGNGSEAIVFRLKRTKKANHLYSLKLTQQQRETLLEFTQLSRNLKKKIEEAGVGRLSPLLGTNSTNSTMKPAKPHTTSEVRTRND